MEEDDGTKALKKAFVDCKCQVNTHNLMNRAIAAVKMEVFVVLKFKKKLRAGTEVKLK